MFEILLIGLFVLSLAGNALALFVIVEGFFSHRKINKFLSSFKLQLAPNEIEVPKASAAKPVQDAKLNG